MTPTLLFSRAFCLYYCTTGSQIKWTPSLQFFRSLSLPASIMRRIRHPRQTNEVLPLHKRILTCNSVASLNQPLIRFQTKGRKAINNYVTSWIGTEVFQCKFVVSLNVIKFLNCPCFHQFLFITNRYLVDSPLSADVKNGPSIRWSIFNGHSNLFITGILNNLYLYSFVHRSKQTYSWENNRSYSHASFFANSIYISLAHFELFQGSTILELYSVQCIIGSLWANIKVIK